MTQRSTIITHLNENGCFLDETLPYTKAGEWFFNCVNSHTALLSFDIEISDPTFFQMLFALNIPAPDDLESSYEVFKLFKKDTAPKIDEMVRAAESNIPKTNS